MRALVREAKPTDYAAITDLATQLVGFQADREAAFDAALRGPDHDLIVAEMEGDLLGFAHLLTYDDVTHGALAADLLGLVVREDRRRQGIGTALLREIIRLATKRGIGELHINTEPDNEAAKRLYVGMGAGMVGVQFEIELSSEPGNESGSVRAGD
jgi:ribosomal protein S18 acetylase RimI-like enzyme